MCLALEQALKLEVNQVQAALVFVSVLGIKIDVVLIVACVHTTLLVKVAVVDATALEHVKNVHAMINVELEGEAVLLRT